ncbi:MAG: hypothetical protein COB15_07620 [Flavobacteriales bacterium]|nr:MAG: hypothetical protein COB15_07620 [Flavobacteriales bacterium]
MKQLLKTVTALLILSVILTSCAKNEGCTDPAAKNFDVEATKDDGSCVYVKEEIVENTTATVTFNFTHHFDGIPVTAANFNQFNFINANGDTMSISKLRYLVSGVKLNTSSGTELPMNGYNLVDVTNGTGLSYTIGQAEFGALANMSFNFGFDTTDNSGNYIDLNSVSWGVPMMMGGGYHNMQLEGKYKVNGVDSLYAYHNIAKKRPTMMAPYEANHIAINLPGIALNQHNVVVEIKMNIAEWFKNPDTWDLNTFHSSLMMNYTAQSMMQANGYNAFTLGIISQKQ